MDPFATPEQMEQRTDGAIPASRPYLADALAAASRRIRNYCGWHIFPIETVEDLRVRATPGHPLWLRTTRLFALDGINSGGAVIDPPTVDWSEDGRVDFTDWSAPALISFTHGYEEAPEDLVDLTLALATGTLASRVGAVREQTLSSSITWARTSGVLTAADKDDLAAYRIGYQP